ncbi:MAG: RiPP maturation radical SAM C-methyltransferase [Synergistaceae bacterium]|jgi:ribosomal peptide maturation radical SAM protein 1|nr:RiPP maturation radical SAM C-methyltransferase [Synergistaceae bacterium]
MICLVNMPFVDLRKQSIGLPLVSGILKEAGMEVTTCYFNFDFAAMMGVSEYLLFLHRGKVPSYLLQWLFAPIAWDWDASRAEESLGRLLAYSGLPDDSPLARRLRELRRDVMPGFMENCVDKIGRISGLSIVGFSCLFFQIPSLALGKMLHDRMPDVKLIYGGSVFHDETGEEVFDRLEWIDALSNSEADDVLAEAFRRLQNDVPLEGLHGMMHRDRRTGKVYKTPGSYVSLEALDNGIVPDMDGYFEAAQKHKLMEFYEKKLTPVAIPFESSRGCWWHEKCPCTFCGLNGVSEAYRAKSPENVLKVLKHYHDKFGAYRFEATDNNLSMGYFDTFLPRLKEISPDGVSLFYCLKANMSRAQIKTLADAGLIVAQPGIESLSDHVLKLMNKGVSAIQNVFFLKCARQYGIYLMWYVILGSYGETQSDCDEIADLVPKITHLTPPADDCWTVQVHRFSAYWRERERYFEEIRPAGWYPCLFPEDFDLDRLAYYFDVKPFAEPASYDGVSRAVSEWRRRWMFDEVPCLFYKEEEGRAALYDSRPEKPVKIVLEPTEAALYRMLDDIVPKWMLMEKASRICPPEDAERILDAFVTHGFAMRSGELHLGLALREGFKVWKREEKFTVAV